MGLALKIFLVNHPQRIAKRSHDDTAGTVAPIGPEKKKKQQEVCNARQTNDGNNDPQTSKIFDKTIERGLAAVREDVVAKQRYDGEN
jgi:hypothetical protein